ncbi:hypothetical protein VNO80_06064 [Phaseolus coccineus]|uniref:Uncharacterized protein n=1 Tax=Phaseolus coccineus TaxID=3886 RepID=A0AAN9RIM6_PHACN
MCSMVSNSIPNTKLRLLTNHFRVNVGNTDGHFFQYSVSISYENGPPAKGRDVGRKVLDMVQNTYDSELYGKDFAYDGDKNLFTLASLPRDRLQFTVDLEDARPTNFEVRVSFVSKIPLQAIVRGQDSDNYQEAIRVLDIILKQHAAKQCSWLVPRFFLCKDQVEFYDLEEGISGLRRFNSRFRTTQSGLSLNIDVSTSMIVSPGSVTTFLLSNQNVEDASRLDWVKAKRTLKNLRIELRNSKCNQQYKITGLTDLICNDQRFTLKKRSGDTEEVTVYDYFVNHRGIQLLYSGDLPCIIVGKPKRPTYFPLEVLSRANYSSEPMLRNCGISISSSFAEVEGRVLQAPRLNFGNMENFKPTNGRWNFVGKKLIKPVTIGEWAVVNFSSKCDVTRLTDDVIKCGETLGMVIPRYSEIIEENILDKSSPPLIRVLRVLQSVQSKCLGFPQFILCQLPQAKSNLYGPWKSMVFGEKGIMTQCMAPPAKITSQYLTNVCLKMNVKLGGMNSMLHDECSIPVVSRAPTIIIGMDVSHGSPGQTYIPSIATVVSSLEWPLISKYRACVRTQSPKVEMIDNLFKKVSDRKDEGIVRELLLDFYRTSGNRKPDNIIIFRDRVSESQFNKVLNIELDQIIKACKFLDDKWNPKFLVIVAQKNHHTKFFQADSPDNVPPGTVIDNKICHPRNYDFYMCAHAGMIGTSRPTHYQVLLDEIGFSPYDLQELVHSLSYVSQRSTTAISVVAPICYAHLAATQMGQCMKFEERSETASSHGGAHPVPQLPKLNKSVSKSMFFC